MTDEIPIFFDCAGDQLLGILHRPEDAGTCPGILLVVGGPQYRVGSHRQFTLLARDLATAGVPVFRFDYRGMGDSSGRVRSFESIAEDIRAALDVFLEQVPELSQVVLWGLCDAATANAFFARSDPRVVGQIALNPWVRTEAGQAEAYVKHYYLQRVLSSAFWKKVFSLRFDPGAAFKDFIRKLRQSRSRDLQVDERAARPLPIRLREAQLEFRGATLLILSGRDLTAREYEMRVDESPAWRDWLQSKIVTVQRLEPADHTFSSAAWRNQVAVWSRDWVLDLEHRRSA